MSKTTFIYVIEAQYDHEGSDIVGAHATESGAEEMKSRMLRRIARWQHACIQKDDWSGKAPAHASASSFQVHKLQVKP
jgi:hypothetical protein